LVEYNGQVYFFVLNNINRTLYKSDGTSSGTVLVKTIPYNTVPYAYVFGGKLYFFGKGLGSSFLFECNGTTAGTFEISPSINSNYYSSFQLATYNSELYLPCNNGGTGVEINKFTPQNLATTSVEKQYFKIYPNPTTDVLWIENDSLQKSWNYQLLDLLGKVFQEGKFNSNKNSISMGNYPSGIYILKLSSGGESQFIKILKK
jgi:ELWxxDGT repeat protein